MRWPLRLQILVPFAGLIVAAILGLTALNAYVAATRAQRQIELQLRQVAGTLAPGNFPLSDRVLLQLHGLSGAHIVASNEAGEVLSSSIPITPGEWTNPEAAPDPAQPELAGPIDVDGRPVFYLAMRMAPRMAGDEATILSILYPVESYRAAVWSAVFPSLAFGALSLASAMALGLWLADRISRPLRMVSRHVGQLAEPDSRRLNVPERNDEVRDLVVAVNDLADQLAAMREAIARQERLVLLGQLSAGMGHHLRNDVTGARIAVQLHQRSCHAADQESLQVALRQLTLTEEHLKRYLAAGEQQPQLTIVECDLSELISEMVDLLRPTLRHRHVALSVQNHVDDSVLPIDAGQLRHAVIAILLNAVEAAGPDGAVEVVLSPCEHDQVCLQIRDSGPGPTAEAERKIFEPFFTTKREGVGLGLTAARQIVAAHGGTLNYLRRDGWTTFELTLPRVAERQTLLGDNLVEATAS